MRYNDDGNICRKCERLKESLKGNASDILPKWMIWIYDINQWSFTVEKFSKLFVHQLDCFVVVLQIYVKLIITKVSFELPDVVTSSFLFANHLPSHLNNISFTQITFIFCFHDQYLHFYIFISICLNNEFFLLRGWGYTSHYGHIFTNFSRLAA